MTLILSQPHCAALLGALLMSAATPSNGPENYLAGRDLVMQVRGSS
jgi:hypothetical protein